MSLFELREVRRKLEEEGRRDVDEELIFEALDRMRARIDEAQHKSKAARRHRLRSPRAEEKPVLGVERRPASPTTKMPYAAPLDAPVEDDPFAEPIRPFEELALKR